MAKAVQEIRLENGIPVIYRWNGWDTKTRIPLDSKPIRVSHEGGKEIMEIQGRKYEVSPTSAKQPCVYLWAEHHAYGNRCNNFDHFMAQADFIMQRGIKRVVHEFFGDFAYDPAAGLYTKRKKVPVERIFPMSAEDFGKDVNDVNRWDFVVEQKLYQDLADILGFEIIGSDVDTERSDYVEREAEQFEVINEYKGSPESPVLAVSGAAHCREVSHLVRLLKENQAAAAIIRDPEITAECEADAKEGRAKRYQWESFAESTAEA